MTDETLQPAGVPQQKTPPLDDKALGPGVRPTGRRHSVTGGRIAAAGIGIAAMLGLVANMEVANGRSQAADPAPSPALATQRTAKGVRQGSAAAPGEVAAAKVKRPIVLTPHAVVHTVSAPSSGGSSGGSGYAAAPAPAAAAAPVVSTSGSR